jgi:hypothetical protein
MLKTLKIAVILSLLAGAAYGGFGEVVSSFPKPAGTGGSGLAWDGAYLWFCGGTYPRFVKTTTTGSVVSSFEFGVVPSDYVGLTFDGLYLWFSRPEQGGGYRYYRFTTNGSYVSRFFKGFAGPGLGWEPPAYLWAGNYKVTTTGSTVATFKPPFPLDGDLAWYGHYLWTGGGTRFYHQLTTNGSIVASFPIPGGAGAGGNTFNGDYIWLVSGGNNWVYQVDIDVKGVNPGSFGKIKGLYR